MWHASNGSIHFVLLFQLSAELGFPVVPKANLTFSKCLEMNLNDHIQTIAKVAEVAGKEYSIEQVKLPSNFFFFFFFFVYLEGDISNFDF